MKFATAAAQIADVSWLVSGDGDNILFNERTDSASASQRSPTAADNSTISSTSRSGLPKERESLGRLVTFPIKTSNASDLHLLVRLDEKRKTLAKLATMVWWNR